MNRSQLYLNDLIRANYKSQIAAFVKILNERLFPNFDNIDDEAEELENASFNELCARASENADPASLAESALEQSLIFYSELRVVKHAFTGISIAGLYHIWEQQVRIFLYKEMRHTIKLNFKDFCKEGIKDIKKYFKDHNVYLERLSCWDKLDEHRLLNNVIKHGDGKAATDLFAKNKTLFKTHFLEPEKYLHLEVTILEETLNISKELFNEYADNLIKFWDELPERSYSS